MTLDDRMRAAQQRRLEQTRDRLDHGFEAALAVHEAPGFGRRLLAAAAAVVVLGGGAVMISRLVSGEAVIETDAANSSSGNGATEPSGTESDQSNAEDQSATTALDEAVTADSTKGEASPADNTPDETPAGAESTNPSDDTDGRDDTDDRGLETSDTELVSEFDAGIETTVCPSGKRASLESATLRYVGPSQGWDRLHNLVDEQDGPFYFKGWEPGFPDSVTVEIELAVPALAADIRLAQDPSKAASGPVTMVLGDKTVVIELAGLDGWKVHTFDQAVEVERFTINRSSAEANVMEVMVCLPETE